MMLNHLAISVPSIADAQEFFTKYLGFRFQFQHGEGVFLTNDGGFQLALDPLKKGEQPPKFPDWFHFGFVIGDDPEKIRTLFKKMKADGVPFARELETFGDSAVNFFCLAPGGYQIEVGWYKS